MWKTVLAGTAALAILGSSAVYAQRQEDGPGRTRWQPSQEDMTAFAAARIAALKAGLALTPEQEKLWPAYESALKDTAQSRMQRRAARQEARQNEQEPNNPVERLRQRAARLSDRSAALKKLADAQEPLYNSLSDAQKRRFTILQRVIRHAGRRHHRRGMRHAMRHQGMRGMMERHEHHRWRDRAERREWRRDRDIERDRAPQGDQGATNGEGERL